MKQKTDNTKSLIDIIKYQYEQIKFLKKKNKELHNTNREIKDEYKRVSQLIINGDLDVAHKNYSNIAMFDEYSTPARKHYGYTYSTDDIMARIDISRATIIAEAETYDAIAKINSKLYFKEEFLLILKKKYHNKIFECWE